MDRLKRIQFWGKDSDDDSLVLEIIEVYKTTFGNIPDKLWKEEVCRSADHFREAHKECRPEYNLTDGFEIMATHFKLL